MEHSWALVPSPEKIVNVGKHLSMYSLMYTLILFLFTQIALTYVCNKICKEIASCFCRRLGRFPLKFVVLLLDV